MLGLCLNHGCKTTPIRASDVRHPLRPGAKTHAAALSRSALLQREPLTGFRSQLVEVALRVDLVQPTLAFFGYGERDLAAGENDVAGVICPGGDFMKEALSGVGAVHRL